MQRAVTAVVATLFVLCASGAFAQEKSREERQRGSRVPAWDPKTVTTVIGAVVAPSSADRGGRQGDRQGRAERQREPRGGRQGGRQQPVMLQLKTDSGNVWVLLGPRDVVDSKLASLPESKTVEVTGSKVAQRGRDVILAATVKVDGNEYKIRNEEGELLDKDGNIVSESK
ncbi:MAG: hypothetical protein HY702_06325 [Gemmatimonadetes bacterium]|nr:hypothetical protein [Gemmatimonadota bacterium]